LRCGEFCNEGDEMTKRTRKLRTALLNIIEECPEPKLPYGKKVVWLAENALRKDNLLKLGGEK